MLGLDAAGKTSVYHHHSTHLGLLTDTASCHHSAILYKLKLNQSVTTIPTGAWNSLFIVDVSLTVAFIRPSYRCARYSWVQRRDGDVQECQV